MTTITVRELKARASEVLKTLESSGEEVVITRRGKPCAKLVRLPVEVEAKESLRALRGALAFLPDLEFQDFMDIKRIWGPPLRPPHGS